MVKNKTLNFLVCYFFILLAFTSGSCYTTSMKKYFNHKIKKALVVDSLITIESLNVSENFTYPTEKHDFYEFAYIDNGTLCCYMEDTPIVLSQGECLLISPQKAHYYTATQGKSASLFIVCFRSNAEILTVFDKKIVVHGELKKLLAEIVQESKNAFSFPFNRKLKLLESPLFGAQQLVENNLEKLFIHLVRSETQKNENIRFVMNSTELESNLVHDIVLLLKDNLYGRITLDCICQQTFYSKTFLNEIFKKNMNSSIMQYYTRLKVSEAKKLLRENLSPAVISSQLCFESATYFTKVFKKHVGMTPSEYKKTILQ